MTPSTKSHRTGIRLAAQGPRPRTILDVDDPPQRTAARGLYIHIPFCFHKCHYCDFYSLVDRKDRQEAFAERLTDEVEAAARILNGSIETIFIGGGTPTLLAAPLWERLLEAIHAHLPIDRVREWTVEANPETVTPELAAVLTEGGVNRVSIGAQSFHPVHLNTLERWHDPENVARAVSIMRGAGITNINLDLINSIPGQTLEEWEDDLNHALALEPDHLSCYTLTYEPNTPMAARLRAGEFERADEDLEAAMYEHTRTRLAQAGFEHYEISNWARPGKQCAHNLLYWRNANWWPLGPGAAGHANGLRWKNAPNLGRYLDSHGLPPAVEVERLDEYAQRGETLMLGLRLIEGMELQELGDLLPFDDPRRSTIERFVQDGVMERTQSHIRLSDRGRLIADSVLSDLL